MKDVNVETIYELTPMQKGMFYINLADDCNTSYHVQNAFWINEHINVGYINKALELLAYKHEVIRTAFIIAASTKKEWQVVLKNRKIEFEYIQEVGTDEKKICDKLKKDDLIRGFDLQKESLMRVKAVKFSSNRYYFLFSFHHIIMDGWCLSLIFEDFISYYLLLSEGKNELELMKEIDEENKNICRYGEYVQWINGKTTDKELNYWKSLLNEYDTTIGVLPIWKPEISQEQVKSIDIRLSQEESRLITAFAARNKITVNSIAETAWGILLQKYNSADDVVFGKVVSGRNIPIKGIEEKVGMFINTIPLRVKGKRGISFVQLASAVYRQDLDSSSFDYCSLNDIQNYIGYSSNLFDTIFVFENYYSKEQNQKRIKIEKEMGREQTNYSLSIKFELKNSIISFNLMYDPGIYTEKEAVMISERLKNILICGTEKDDILVDDINMLAQEEYKKLIDEFNNKEKCAEHTIVEILEKRVEENSDRIALVFDNKRVTYSEFNENVNIIAHRLRSMGVKTGDFVAVIAEASIKTLESIYGVIKSSAAYVPIDPSLPEERIRFILNDCKPKVIITNKENIQGDIAVINLNSHETWIGCIYNPENISKPSDVAYCIYTSGTTGTPKGVLVEHKGVPNLGKFFVDKLGINKEDAILQFASLGFDASVWEMTMGLLTGARLIIPTNEERNSYELLVSLSNKENITVVTLPTQFYANLEGLRVRLVITAGSESDKGIVSKAIHTGAEYINAYGPTEFTVAASYWKYSSNSNKYRKIPIGKPIDNSGICILNGMQVCGIGVTGELCVAGIGIARGYLNKKELTEEKFIQNPFGSGKLYRSGDLARWLPDGNIEFLGRIDEQVKIHGFRIELKEIENVLKQIEYIKDAAVIVKSDGKNEKYICAYFVSDICVDIKRLKTIIGKSLPHYMIPRYSMQIDCIPVTLSGKVDKTKLPDCDKDVARAYKKPENDIQKQIIDIFKKVLNIHQAGIEDEFMQIGGNSLSAMKCVVEFKKMGYIVSISELLKYQTAEKIADHLLRLEKEDEKNEDCNITDRWDDITEIIQYIDKKIENMQKKILAQNPNVKYKAGSIQKISYDKNLLKSGVYIELNSVKDDNAMYKAINSVINANGLLRSYLMEEEGQLFINESIMTESLEIPYANISSASEKLKEDIHDFYINLMYLEDIWNKKDIFHNLLYKIIVIRFSHNITRIYMPCCHLIFDAMSSEIIENMLRKSLTGIMIQGDSYYSYLTDIEKGPCNITSKEIGRIFNLEKINKNLYNFTKVKRSDYKKEFIRIYIRDTKNFHEGLLWNISHKLFIYLLKYNFGLDDFTYAILSTDRKRMNKNYYEGIGEYLDLIPMNYTFGSGQKEVTEEEISNLIEVKNNHNINFSSLAYNKPLAEKYFDIAEIIRRFIDNEKVPVFNFLGIYGGIADKLNDANVLEEHLFWVDACYDNGYILMSGFAKKDDAGELNAKLQNILDKM